MGNKMLGKIKSYDEKAQMGVISTEQEEYAFHIDDWEEDVPPEEGDEVIFEENDGEIGKISLLGAQLPKLDPVKSRVIAGLLGLILGAVGAHRFYLGYYKIAIYQIIFTAVTMGYGLLWGFVEGFLIISGNFNKDAKGRPLK
jgi:hypothetical protein